MGTVEVQTTIDSAIQLITNVNNKLDLNGTTPQASPDSGKSSSVSGDSGVLDDRSLIEKKQSDGDQQTQESINGAENGQPHAGVSSVLQQLEQLIISDDWVTKDHPHNVASATSSNGKTRSHSEGPRLSELGRTLITSSSLKAYIDLLGAQHRQSIAAWLYGNTSQILSKLFHLPSGNLYCSDADSSLTNSLKSGIGYAVRLALRDRYGVERLGHGWKAFVEMVHNFFFFALLVHLVVSRWQL